MNQQNEDFFEGQRKEQRRGQRKRLLRFYESEFHKSGTALNV